MEVITIFEKWEIFLKMGNISDQISEICKVFFKICMGKYLADFKVIRVE